MLRSLLTFFAILVCSIHVSAETVRLLTIGNSFSRNATHYLGDLAKAGGHTLIHRPIVVGGASFELHSEKALKHAANAQDKAGLYTNGRSLIQELKADSWDYVTIQQASLKSHDLSTYQPHAGRLSELIHRHAPSAKLRVHQTWAYRKDDPRFTKPSGKPGEPKTQAEMYACLSAAYAAITKELSARRIPVGDAFYLADTDPQWGYQTDTDFDFNTAKQPALPVQKHSLHVGWQWKPQKSGKTTFSMGHHANVAGEYLGACVWYEVLFGQSPVGNAYVPVGLDAAYTRFLQETAHRAVMNEQTATQ